MTERMIWSGADRCQDADIPDCKWCRSSFGVVDVTDEERVPGEGGVLIYYCHECDEEWTETV